MIKRFWWLIFGVLATTAFAETRAATDAAAQQFTYFQAVILGIVEGVTEFLPVSSTGHLELVSHWMKMPKDAVDSFNIVIQGASLLAIIGLYRRRMGQVADGVIRGDSNGRKLLIHLAISFFPAAFVGLLFHKSVKQYLFNPPAIAFALIAGGIAMILLERRHRSKQGFGGLSIDQMGWRIALMIGLAQILSLWPGTSRSMTTILGAMAAGMSLQAAAEYSFLLAVPTLGAAALYELAKGYHEIFIAASPGVFLTGMVVSAIVAAAAVKGFVGFLSKGGLSPFGYYRILTGVLVLWLVW